MTSLSPLAGAALAYAEMGWPVLPIKPRDKLPLGRLVPHGLKQATTDPDTVRGWWGEVSDANIGIATGVEFDALDVDGDSGMAALGPAMPVDGPTVDGPTVTTGRGCHVYVAPTGLGNRAGVLDHVDWRGRGGYVVAPPSVHPSGAVYAWHLGADDPDFGVRAPIRPAPAWLLDVLRKPAQPQAPAAGGDQRRGDSSAYGRAALEREVGRIALALVGQRNDTLNRAAFALGQLVAGGALTLDEVIESLLVAASRAGLAEVEARPTIASGLRGGLARPRRVAS